MPKGGRRPGAGRPPGPSKARTERALIAEQTIARAEMRGEKLAKEVLNDFMKLFAGMAGAHQPFPPGTPANPYENRDLFDRYARLAVATASELASYQSPTFKAIAISAPPPESNGPRPTAQIIDINSPAVLQRAYQRMLASK